MVENEETRDRNCNFFIVHRCHGSERRLNGNSYRSFWMLVLISANVHRHSSRRHRAFSDHPNIPFIRLSGKFLSFYEEIIDAQRLFVLYYFVELRTIHFVLSRQTSRHFTHLVSRLYVCERKTLFGQPNTIDRTIAKRQTNVFFTLPSY